MSTTARFFLSVLALGTALTAKAIGSSHHLQQHPAVTQAVPLTDSLFIYSPNERQGLHVAVADSTGWQHLGQLCISDYGTWGVEKRMYHPSLCRAKDGSWRLVFQVNDTSPLFAAAYSRDLVTWRPQDYPRVGSAQCLQPVVTPMDNTFNVYYRDAQGHARRISASKDFRRFTNDMAMPFADQQLWRRDSVVVGDRLMLGQKFAVTADEVLRLRTFFDERAKSDRLSAERMHDDEENEIMKKLKNENNGTLRATLTVRPDSTKAISDKLIGIFFEDISYAADGGLYAELIQNRDFEYNAKDHDGWSATTAWHSSKPIEIATEHPLHPNNPHYALLWPDTIWNEGWDGIRVEMGKKYDFSMFVLAGGQKQDFAIQLVGHDGTVLAKGELKTRASDWKQYATVLTATASDDKARLVIVPLKVAHVGIDMVSLFPQDTFKGRKNGLRKDLAETIAALHPKFVRFPGGCLTHGQGLDNIYHWQHTVGPLQERKPDFNIWHYHQTRGLGFYEYFQFCEDIGAEPLPVLAAGVPCQNSAANAEGIGGQQGGIPMEQMPAYIDELCNLIEWANGDPATSPWAKMRADAGHPAPFHLKYLGIGNEDIIGTVFEGRYEMICRALRQRHPEIQLCGTVGPFHAPSADYTEGWDFIHRHPELQDMTDEHYYESTGWFMHHRDYYDSYPRLLNVKSLGAEQTSLNTQHLTLNSPKVYLGEWAASTRARRPNVETALAEALYLTDIERNGDIVSMTSYAPLLCKDGHSNWNPDMIYFSNAQVRTTPAYEVQRLFSVYSGDTWVHTEILGDSIANLRHRIGASLVVDSRTGKRYLKLVNALPVTLNLAVEGLTLPSQVECEQFSGDVEDQRAKAVCLTTDTPLTLPPYTLRVISLNQ